MDRLRPPPAIRRSHSLPERQKRVRRLVVQKLRHILEVLGLARFAIDCRYERLHDGIK
jgi:hypothetical protein